MDTIKAKGAEMKITRPQDYNNAVIARLNRLSPDQRRNALAKASKRIDTKSARAKDKIAVRWAVSEKLFG